MASNNEMTTERLRELADELEVIHPGQTEDCPIGYRFVWPLRSRSFSAQEREHMAGCSYCVRRLRAAYGEHALQFGILLAQFEAQHHLASFRFTVKKTLERLQEGFDAMVVQAFPNAGAFAAKGAQSAGAAAESQAFPVRLVPTDERLTLAFDVTGDDMVEATVTTRDMALLGAACKVCLDGDTETEEKTVTLHQRGQVLRGVVLLGERQALNQLLGAEPFATVCVKVR